MHETKFQYENTKVLVNASFKPGTWTTLKLITIPERIFGLLIKYTDATPCLF